MNMRVSAEVRGRVATMGVIAEVRGEGRDHEGLGRTEGGDLGAGMLEGMVLQEFTAGMEAKAGGRCAGGGGKHLGDQVQTLGAGE